MRLAFLAFACVFAAGQAQAENYAGCAANDRKVAETALDRAKELTLKAAVAVGDTPQYRRWFGEYSQANAETVRANLKAVVTAIRSGAVRLQCDSADMDGCEGGTYAWVYPNIRYVVHLCPNFFRLQQLEELVPGAVASDNGTREGTMVHEISHFLGVAQTEDHCYSRSECSDMARDDAALAIDNADSYQYFTEDVTYYARQPVPGKPPAADRR